MGNPSLLVLAVLLSALSLSAPCRADDDVLDITQAAPTTAAKPSPDVKPTPPANKPVVIVPSTPAPGPEDSGTASRERAPAPASNPESEVAQVSRDAENLARGGNGKEARALLAAELELHPGDPTLAAAAKLLDKEDLRSRAPERIAKAASEALRIFEGRKPREIPLVKMIGGDGLEAVYNENKIQEASVLPFGAAPLRGAAQASAAGMAPAGRQATSGEIERAGWMTREMGRLDTVGDHTAALALVDRRLAAAPGDRELRVLRTSELVKSGRYAEAESGARALLVSGEDPLLRTLLSRALNAQGRPAEALVQAHRAVALDPRSATARLVRAEAYVALGDNKAGLNDLYAAAQLDPRFQPAFREQLKALTSPPPMDSRKLAGLGALVLALLAGIGWQLRRLFGARTREEPGLANVMAQLLPISAAAPAGFEIEKEIGRGAMGVVYQARDLQLQRTVAIKRMRPELSSSPKDRERFVNEGRLTAGLRHPNIMEVFRVGADGAGLFSIFEFIPGYSLVEDLDGRPMRLVEAVGLLRQIAAALDYAHGEGVVHQDLKPGNIMLSGLTVKVVDFGIARHMEEVLSTQSHARGTPAYMAPEQELRAAPRPAADIWSLGAIAYEMVTGVRPFSGSLDAKRSRLFRPASQVAGNLPKGVDAVFARCFDPDPTKRWPTAGAFVAELAKELKLPVAPAAGR